MRSPKLSIPLLTMVSSEMSGLDSTGSTKFFWDAGKSPEADAARAGLFAVNDNVEAVFHIEGNVALVLRFQIADVLLGVGALEDRAHQRATESAPLNTRLDAEDKQVPASSRDLAQARLPLASDHFAIALIRVIANKIRNLM